MSVNPACYASFLITVGCLLLAAIPASIPFHKFISCRLPCRCIHPFSRTPLHDLLSSVHPKVVPVFPQCPSQRLYWYNQFCFHLFILSSYCAGFNPALSASFIGSFTFALRSHYGHHRTIPIGVPAKRTSVRCLAERVLPLYIVVILL